MFNFIKQAFILLLRFIGSLASNFMFLNDGSCSARPTIINLNQNSLCYNSFKDRLGGRFNGSCLTLDDLSSRICVPYKTENVKLNVFDLIKY